MTYNGFYEGINQANKKYNEECLKYSADTRGKDNTYTKNSSDSDRNGSDKPMPPSAWRKVLLKIKLIFTGKTDMKNCLLINVVLMGLYI